MAKIEYRSKNFRSDSLLIIARINQIVEQYQADGLSLTLRQVYYQFVSRDWLANNDKNYDMLGGILSDARLAGLVDWEAIEDRGRKPKSNSHWSSPQQTIRAVADQFQIDKWAEQKYRPEVFVEKDALVGVIEEACRPLDVTFLSCRGYASQTALHDTAMRLQYWIGRGKTPVIFHLGDHDPSGIDMSRDIQAKMDLFVGMGKIEVRRIALTMEQIREYNPPPNPAKMSDSRAKKYVEEYGDESWELDALEPRVLISLITSAIKSVRNEKQWKSSVVDENTHKKELGASAEHWELVTGYMEQEGWID